MPATRLYRFGILMLVLTIAALIAPAAFAQNAREVSLPSERTLNQFGLELAWWNHAAINRSLDRVQHFTADEDVTFVQSRRGTVTVFENGTGKKLWTRQLGRSGDVNFPAMSDSEIAIIAAGSNVYGIHKFSGLTAWNIPIPGAPSTSPVSDSKQMYVGTVDGAVYAFDTKKLMEYEKEGLLPRWANMTQQWVYQTGSEVSAPPVTTGVVVNVASNDGQLYGLSAGDRQLRFQFETDAPIAASIAQAGNYLFLASEDFNVYCINADNGVIRWEFVTGQPIRKQAQVVGNQVYLMPVGGGMYCVSESDGEELWLNTKADDFLAATNSLVYASDRLGNLLILDRDNGATLGMIPLCNYDVHLANDRTDRILLATSTGLVICLREIGRPFPLYHKHPDRQPVLPEVTPEAEAQGEQPTTEDGATDTAPTAQP